MSRTNQFWTAVVNQAESPLRAIATAASLCLTGASILSGSTAIIVDHNCTTLSAIPEAAITQAKASLHIAYGHTSHGSQLTDGMTGLETWKGTLYAWNGTGADGALHLEDYYGSFGGSSASDLGSPDRTTWESATRTFLAANTDINVIIWSWCGQVDGTEAEIAQYLSLMSGLEADFPNVKFVYMTGHLTGTGEEGNVNVRNEQIRTYCKNNGKILYDFADIESYDPDGLVNYMELYADDGCNYILSSVSHNWATEWQSAHTVNVDWYSCDAAHSVALNANRKAYAAWYLWARLGGWNGGNLAWSDYDTDASLDNWYSSWYGWFYNDDRFGNWIYSAKHEYQYVWSGSTSDSVYTWDNAIQSWWWTSDTFYPALYSYATGKWYCYLDGTGANRTFWDYSAAAVVGASDL